MSAKAAPSALPTIAVVIPTRNRPDTLVRALASVFGQTSPPAEVIVVDDGSEMPVSEAIFSDAPAGIRCQVLRNRTAMGANAARNRGMEQAEADYIAFLDDDDEFISSKIAILQETLDTTPCDIVHHGARIVYDNEKISYETKVRSGFDFKDLLIGNLVGGTSLVCVNRAFVLTIGGFDQNLPALQDWDLWLRSAEHGGHFHAIEAFLTVYHFVTGKPAITMSISNAQKALKMIDTKFADALAQLTPGERRRRQRTDASRLAFRYALADNRLAASATFLRGAITSRSPSLLIAAGVSLFGIRYLALARRYMG